jgi:hypothetical protein
MAVDNITVLLHPALIVDDAVVAAASRYATVVFAATHFKEDTSASKR